MCEAIYAQKFQGYEFADAITKQNKTWKMLNPEQQAYLIQRAYQNNFFSNNSVWTNNVPIVNSSNNQIPQQFLINYMSKVVLQLQSGVGAT